MNATHLKSSYSFVYCNLNLMNDDNRRTMSVPKEVVRVADNLCLNCLVTVLLRHAIYILLQKQKAGHYKHNVRLVT